jgi:hypothetical protein
VGATATLSRSDDHVALLDSAAAGNDYYVGPVLVNLGMDVAFTKNYVSRVRLHEIVCPVPGTSKAEAALRSARKAPYLEHLLAPYMSFERTGGAVVFVNHPPTAETLARRLFVRNDPTLCCFYMTSDVPPAERNCILKHFNNIEGDTDAEVAQLLRFKQRPRVMFTTVGQEGMNVSSCTRVIHFNPVMCSGALDAQRTGRAARKKHGCDEPSDCYVLLTPAEHKARLTKHNARAYTTAVFGEEWVVDASPSKALARVYADEDGEAFRALVGAESGTRDALVARQAKESRDAAAAKRKKTVNVRQEIIKKLLHQKRGSSQKR